MLAADGGQRLTRDNRQSARIASRIRCWCEGENVTLYARIANLSEGGLFLQTSTPLAQGARAMVRLGGGLSPELQAQATVVWNRQQRNEKRPPGMGLRFEPLQSGELDRLRQIISQEQRSHGLAVQA